MLANILVIGFVSAYLAIVVLGHVLLVTAIWPHPFRRRHLARTDAVTGSGHALNQPS